jgi:hypothetical protein
MLFNYTCLLNICTVEMRVRYVHAVHCIPFTKYKRWQVRTLIFVDTQKVAYLVIEQGLSPSSLFLMNQTNWKSRLGCRPANIDTRSLRNGCSLQKDTLSTTLLLEMSMSTSLYWLGGGIFRCGVVNVPVTPEVVEQGREFAW